MSLIETMDRRISVRTFSLEVPEGELLEHIERIIKKKRKGPFGKALSLTLMDIIGEHPSEMGKMTSYGIIKDARFFFGGYCDGDDRSIIDFGYCFEEALLELTALDLGTCWMGGTFGRGFIARMLSLPEDKVIPAISPVGFGLEKRALIDKLTRFFARSKNRKPYHKLFFNYTGENSLQPAMPEEMRFPVREILESVRSAPSASNKQPWRVIMENDLYHFYWDCDFRYNSMIKGFNIQALDMGIAICHFMKAAEELRFRGRLTYADPHFENVKWKYVLSWKVNS